MPHTLEKTPVEHGRYIDERRQDLGLKWSEVARDMDRLHNISVTSDYLSKIKRGVAPLSKMSVDAREALRKVLRIDAETWEQETGLYASEAPQSESAPRRPGPPSVAPVVPFRQTRITIPRELQEMVEKHGDAYPILKTEQMQRMLAAPRNFGGAEVGPQTAEDWFDYWMANKRFLT